MGLPGSPRPGVRRRERPNVAMKRLWDKPAASKRLCRNWLLMGLTLLSLRHRSKTSQRSARSRCRARSRRGQAPPNRAPQPFAHKAVSSTCTQLKAYVRNGGSCREKVIEDCGHYPQIEKPEEFRQTLFGFLERH